MRESVSEPRPRVTPQLYVPFDWPVGKLTLLPPAAMHLQVDIASISQERQSRRRFAPMSVAQLGTLLWLTCRTHSSRASEYGFDQHFRPHPSAGAIHPIHVICQRAPSQPWERYDPGRHVLVTIPGSEELAQNARMQAEKFFTTGEAVLLALVAEGGKTAAKYESEQSLVWRDAGVVLGYLSLVSEALGLSFCPLGATGHSHLAPVAPAGILQGAGLAVLGARGGEVQANNDN